MNGSVSKTFSILIVLLLIIIVGIGVYVFFAKDMFFSSLHGGNNTNGIYLSLVEKPAQQHFMGIYKFVPSTRTLSPYIPLDATHDTAYFTSALSPDNSKVTYASFAFVRALSDSGQPVSGDPQLSIANSDGTNIKVVNLSRDIKLVRNPIWSSDGTHIIFSARRDYNGGNTDLSSWYVYSYDLSTQKIKYITSGSNQKFIPNGDLLVLKSDGIYLIKYTQPEWATFRIFPMNEATTINRFAISPDSKKLAVNFPEGSTVVLTDVTSWDPYTEGARDTIKIYGDAPVFSPDSTQLAILEEPVAAADSQNGASHLVTFDVETKTKIVDYTLSNYDPDSIFVTDWK